LNPLGNGGFGEVWKCAVPGGLCKAIKFIEGDLNGLDEQNQLVRQELSALARVKDVRHPFLLSLERVEVIDGQLMIVTELADRTLYDVFLEHRDAGRPGIPRDQLLGYLLEAAEALDALNFTHGLQHLDIKPSNLFLVGNYVKVADFGLVQSLCDLHAEPMADAKVSVTPRYAAPELFEGRLSRQSDQYSLALVYQELLTGTFPFPGRNAQQLMVQHARARPDLDALPIGDQPLVARALAKEPEQRFASCVEFVRVLIGDPDWNWGDSTATAGNAVRLDPPEAGPTAVKPTRPAHHAGQPTKKLHRLRTRRPRTSPQTPARPRAADAGAMTPATAAEAGGAGTVRENLNSFLPAHLPLVMPCACLAGTAATVPDPTWPTAGQLLTAFLREAGCSVGHGTSHRKRYLLRSSNALECGFPVRVIPTMLELKLAGYCEHWQATVWQRAEESIVLRLHDAGGLWQRFVGRQGGLEIHVQLPPRPQEDAVLSEVRVRIHPFGSGRAQRPDLLTNLGPVLLDSLRAFLHASDQRARGRIRLAQLVRVFPVLAQGRIGTMLSAEGKDLSPDGLGLILRQALPTEQLYVSLGTAPPAAAFALLARVVRKRPAGLGRLEVGTSFLIDPSWSNTQEPEKSVP
jgi:hypothetical protein